VAYDGAVALEKPPPGHTLELYPWMAGTDILITTCGFAKVIYNETPIRESRDSYRDQPRRRTAYQAMTGEWCRLGEFLFEDRYRDEQLLVYRPWQGKKYLLNNTPVYQDDDGADYIARRDFVEYAELGALLRSVAQGRDNNGCFAPDGPELESRKDTEDLVRIADMYCFNRGVYLRDLARSLRKAAQTPRAAR
jgi:hypothetical protein